MHLSGRLSSVAPHRYFVSAGWQWGLGSLEETAASSFPSAGLSSHAEEAVFVFLRLASLLLHLRLSPPTLPPSLRSSSRLLSREAPEFCCICCSAAGFCCLLNEVIRRHCDPTHGICSACCISASPPPPPPQLPPSLPPSPLLLFHFSV